MKHRICNSQDCSAIPLMKICFSKVKQIFKLTSIFLSALLFIQLLMPIQALGFGNEAEEITVTFTYEQALRMALSDTLSERDITAQIQNMQMRHRDLDDEIRRGIPERQNNDLWNDIQGLDWAIWGAHSEMLVLEQSIEFHMGQLLFALETGDTMMVAEALPAVIFAISSLHGMGGRIATMEAQRSMMFDEVWRIQSEPQTRDLLREARNDLNELERQINTLNLHQAQYETVVELLLRSLIVELSEADLQISTLRAELEFAEVDIRRLTLANELGFISIHELQAAEHGLEQGYAGLEGLIRNRSAVLQDINHLLGQPLSQNTAITFNRTMPEIPQDLDRHIGNVISQDPAIRGLQIEIDSARGERWAYTGNNNDIRISDADRRRAMNNVGVSGDTVNREIMNLRHRIALQDAVDRAVMAREQAVRTMEAAMQRGFADLEGLFALEASLMRDLTQAQSTLNVTTTNFQLGHATQLDAHAARLNITRIEQDIEILLSNIWVLAFMLENPSLLSAQ